MQLAGSLAQREEFIGPSRPTTPLMMTWNLRVK